MNPDLPDDWWRPYSLDQWPGYFEMDNDLEVGEFELHWPYYINFRTNNLEKGMEHLIPSSIIYKLNKKHHKKLLKIFVHHSLALSVECSLNGPGNWGSAPSRVVPKIKKGYLIPLSLAGRLKLFRPCFLAKLPWGEPHLWIVYLWLFDQDHFTPIQ